MCSVYAALMEISFYHLSVTPIEKATPTLLDKAYEGGMRAHLLCAKDDKQKFDDALWTFHPRKFLPHGTDESDIDPKRQPVLISDKLENLNSSTVLAIANGEQVEDFGKFVKVLDIFDGNYSEQLDAARARWKAYKDGGHTLRYWFQDDKGKWVEKDA